MRFFACLLTASLILSAPLHAQETARPHAPRTLPRPSTLDDLFDRLAKAQSEDEATGITSLIERRWARSGSDTADLLLSRASDAFDAKDYPLSVELLDRVLALQPGWAEAWYRRAIVFYQLDDPVGAMADLYQALKLEPRHFGAWTGLGHIYLSSDDKPHALEAYRRALKLNPQSSTVQLIVSHLDHDVDGVDL
ncbi:tetratricopeptide repeat protein [Microvirga terricola]|uniref:Tetratricopeptide repeat protein n=1 Tax=Microvirga terricola TaxID=2719797 RepID=A0ABX0VHU9_9HYPH|nr:tetratricopeptide repeat protein [Microvirga terricola]NIX77967.1 tetratricopeptide repeat protein [Microvirga terricola]